MANPRARSRAIHNDFGKITVMVHHSNVHFNNLYFTHELLDDKDYTHTLFRLTDQDKKWFEMTNCDIKVWGKALTTYDALSF